MDVVPRRDEPNGRSDTAYAATGRAARLVRVFALAIVPVLARSGAATCDSETALPVEAMHPHAGFILAQNEGTINSLSCRQTTIPSLITTQKSKILCEAKWIHSGEMHLLIRVDVGAG